MVPESVLILGDLMEDVYWRGTAERLSPEAPIPVVKVAEQDGVLVLPGGAGNVAQNMNAFGILPVGVCGAGTPRKHRLLVGDRQIARWDQFDSCKPITEEEIRAEIIGHKLGGVLVADYAKGSITPETPAILDKIFCTRLPIFVDTKADPTPWLESALWVFPNRREYEQYKDAYDQFGGVVLKLGEEGLELRQQGQEPYRVPALARHVRSVNGAGDTVVAAFARAWFECRDPRLATEFAAAAAASVVEAPYTAATCIDFVAKIMKERRKVSWIGYDTGDDISNNPSGG